jgi:uncharacterized membrane protein YqiK
MIIILVIILVVFVGHIYYKTNKNNRMAIAS